MDSNLPNQLKVVAEHVNGEVRKYFSEHLRIARDIDPVFEESLANIQTFVLRGGKRARSFLTWCAYRLTATENSSIYQVCTAVELHHFYLCTIDDMADRDTVRHGGPTLQQVYRKQFAHLSQGEQEHKSRFMGEISAALIENAALELLATAGFSAEKKQESLLHLLRIMTEQTAAGWLIHHDQNEEKLAETSEERFIRGLKHVTAFYTFVGLLYIGSTLANVTPEIQKVLKEYGSVVGTAFQIYDDILGLFGDPKETGKSAANDVKEGKKTLLLQRAHRASTVEDKTFLEYASGNHDLSEDEIERVRNIVRKTGALEDVKKEAKQMVEEGKAALKQLQTSCDPEIICLLEDVADFIIDRKN